MISHGFELLRQEQIDELNATASLYRHIKTGAELLAIQNDDENKVFNITFRTPPSDSTGVPHIMEHSVLGGSRKYQAREPFVELIKGSLNTFLNAFTASDWTTYPVASTNRQDFYNLVDVYLDAVFYPLITPHHLDQEGWHYELENLDDPLVYKGVVFNEMKGAFSSPDSYFYRQNQHALFPDHLYGHESGGDPVAIPDLTYEQFKGFHETFYHPSNARIFVYGDDPEMERLRILDEYLRDFDPIDVDSAVPTPAKFDQPRTVTYPYSVDKEDDFSKKGMVQVNWMLPEGTDPELVMAWEILSYALVSTPASPLRKALIDSGLGEELTGGGLSNDLRVLTFNVGLKGVAVEDAPQVEGLILQTLTQLAEEGFESDMVEAAVNTTEFQLRENNTGSYPRGLILSLRTLATWLYDADPFAPLKFEGPLTAVKTHLAQNSNYLQEMITQHLLDNNHRVTVILEPDPALADQMEQAEKERLATIRAQMSDADLQVIIDNTRALKKRQETPDSPEVLAAMPSLTLADIDKENKEIPIDVAEIGGSRLLFHDLFTNGIAYLDVGFDLHALPDYLLPYVNLFGEALLKMGTEEEDFVKLSQRIGRKTGGIQHMTHSSAVQNSERGVAWLFLRGKATMPQTADLLDILRDVLLTSNLDDRDRFRQLVLEAKAGQEAMIIPAGHNVVNRRLSAQFNEGDWAAEQMNGLAYLFFLRQLAERIESDWAGVLADLTAVRTALVNRQAMLFNVTLDEENYAQFLPQLEGFVASLPTAAIELPAWNLNLQPVDEGLTIPAQVNYVGKGANLYQLGYQLHGSAAVITSYLRITWLWERVRVQGGAYGGFCRFDRHSGLFNYLSYRDPNLTGTLENYDKTADFLKNLDLSNEELTKSIIGTIGDIDSYQLPDAKGFTSLARYLLGSTAVERQKYRDEVLSTTQADFKAFADVLAQAKDHSTVVVLGSGDAINAANEDGWLQVSKVM